MNGILDDRRLEQTEQRIGEGEDAPGVERDANGNVNGVNFDSGEY